MKEITGAFTGASAAGIAYDNTNIFIYNIAGNSANITNRPVKMVITYKE